MKSKILYILIITCFLIQGVDAQFDCNQSLEVVLDEDGEGEFLASDLVPNVDFYVANGTVTYYIVPFISGTISSGDDIISVDCSVIWSGQYIFEFTQNDELVASCNGILTFSDPMEGCPNITSCEDGTEDCHKAVGSYSYYSENSFTVDAESFAICADAEVCTGTYGIAIGELSDAENLTYTPSLSSNEITEYITPIVLAYTENGVTQYDNTNFYAWQNLDCFLIPKGHVTVELDLTAEATIIPELFLQAENTCIDVKMAVTELNGSIPTEYFDLITVDCDDLGYMQVYLKDELTGMISKSQLFVGDPLETCGPILGPGDKLIKMSNDPPLGTYSNTKISLNGEVLPVSPAGKGWIINEEQLLDGNNTLDFDAGPFILNGVSTLDLVRLLYLIIYDEYDDPMQSIVMDLDGSGYNGIGDLLLTRSLILGFPNTIDIPNVLFKPVELEFPVDFNPFDFDYDFTKYDFDSADFETLSFLFEGHKVGDINGTAIVEDGLKNNEIATTRNVGVFEVSEMEITAGVPFEFTFSYDSGVPFKGLLAALVSNGISFESLTSEYEGEVQYNILNDNEIRISYISADPTISIDNINFEIKAMSSVSGSLIDLLGLKPGFPNEVINITNEVIHIDDIEEESTTSTIELSSSIDVEIFPNPAQDMLSISIPSGEIGAIEVFDANGQKIMKTVSDSNEIVLDISILPKGVYHLSFQNRALEARKSFIKM